MYQSDCVPLAFVVDDGSPAPAIDDLSALTESERQCVTLIAQRNAGPAAARNRALARIPDDVPFAAFLDSDDQWNSRHLSRALRAFDQGADLYFSDFIREGATHSRFVECGVSGASGVKLKAGDELYRYSGDLFSAILRKSPIGTSTVVFRRRAAPCLAFREDLRAGEDILFWLSLVRRASFCSFSTHCDAEYGRGVNIFASATWGTPQVLRYLADAAKMHRLAAQLFPLAPDLRRWNDAWRRELRQSYAQNFLHLLRRNGAIDWRSLAQYVAMEPHIGLDIIRYAMRNLVKVRKASGR